MDDDIWLEASAVEFLTDEDFEIEYGRPRTPDEQARHEMFQAAVLLSEPGTSLTAGPDEGTGERL